MTARRAARVRYETIRAATGLTAVFPPAAFDLPSP